MKNVNVPAMQAEDGTLFYGEDREKECREYEMQLGIQAEMELVTFAQVVQLERDGWLESTYYIYPKFEPTLTFKNEFKRRIKAWMNANGCKIDTESLNKVVHQISDKNCDWFIITSDDGGYYYTCEPSLNRQIESLQKMQSTLNALGEQIDKGDPRTRGKRIYTLSLGKDGDKK